MQSKQTPMIRQYLSIKEQYPDAILFYRMGDFYEMFFEDAEVASRLLEITLTSRNKNNKQPIPMCGVPHRAVQGYIARLLEQGMKVAICDQVEDPAQAKGLVKREVVRIVTPGMIIENEFLDAKSNNFVTAVAAHKRSLGIACLDLSTGTFRITESEDHRAINDELLRISPSELLLPEKMRTHCPVKEVVNSISEKAVTYMEDRDFDFQGGREALIEQFQVFNLEGFGCENLKAGVEAAGALLRYVSETQRRKIDHLTGIETYILSDYLSVDDQSCRNLELLANIRTGKKEGSLLHILDDTVTAMGGRQLRQWLRYPLVSPERIEARLEAVGEAVDKMLAATAIREHLKSVYDLERLGSRILMSHATPREMVALKRSIFALPEILAKTIEFDSPLFHWSENIDELTALANIIEAAVREDAPPTINEGGIIKDGWNEELDELIQISRDGKGYLARLEAEERTATGINSLKVRFNKVFGYYLEVPKTHSDKIPDHYIRKQTLVNAERYITDDLKKFENKVLNAEEKRISIELQLFHELRDKIRGQHPLIQQAARFISRLDCLLNLALVAHQNEYRRPEISRNGALVLEDARHPVIEKMITAERFVPNTICMDNEDNQILLITGPNMAGKSTVLRQAALLTIMAQMGGFVPARKAKIPVTDRIFTRVGALDNLSQGQSTFMVEMQETANILNNATPDSLVILDEIGRGTSTFDGLSIAWAVAEHLHDLKGKGVKTLFATHYHELTALEKQRERVKNYHIAVKEKEDDIIFLRKLLPGGTNRSYGIQVARLAGLPPLLIQRAKEVLETVEAENQHLEMSDGVGESKQPFQTAHTQMGLFSGGHEEMVVDAIRDVDLARMTPLDAMNFLNDLKVKTRFH